MNEFGPVSYEDGYLPIEDHGLIGAVATAALIGRDGAISGMCAPRFDSPPLFCRLLDAQRGGAFSVAPEDLIESRQYYEPDAAVLVNAHRLEKSGDVARHDRVPRVAFLVLARVAKVRGTAVTRSAEASAAR